MRYLILLTLLIVIIACAGSRRQTYVDNHPHITTKMRQLILQGRIVIGMTDAQLRASWGNPRRVNSTHMAHGVHQQWIYGYSSSSNPTYVYLMQGVVTSWQN